MLLVNLCQKLLFLHQLTNNMTTNCSFFLKIISSEYWQNMLCTQIVVVFKKNSKTNISWLGYIPALIEFLWRDKGNNHYIVHCVRIEPLQVNNCQKFLFLHQLTNNMTTDCSLNHVFSKWKFQVQNMLCTQIVFCFAIQNNLCTQHVLSLEFSCTEVGIQWSILCILWVSWCKNKGFWHRFTCTANPNPV